jgi:hypothetical protein
LAGTQTLAACPAERAKEAQSNEKANRRREET